MIHLNIYIFYILTILIAIDSYNENICWILIYFNEHECGDGFLAYYKRLIISMLTQKLLSVMFKEVLGFILQRIRVKRRARRDS